MQEPPSVLCRRATIGEVLSLRHRILIAGTTRASAVFDGDDVASTWHFAAFDRESRCLACVSYMRADLAGEPAYQLRGMAVTQELQGRGIGSRLLGFAEAEMIARTSVHVHWCNARMAAVVFYEHHGWRSVGDVFEIEGVGPHYRMVKRVSGSSSPRPGR